MNKLTQKIEFYLMIIAISLFTVSILFYFISLITIDKLTLVTIVSAVIAIPYITEESFKKLEETAKQIKV